MPLSILAITLLAVWGLGLPWAIALLLAASLAPTDPVLASDIQIGPPKTGDEAQIPANIAQLTQVVGPDFTAGVAMKENRAGRVAEAGGKTIVNTIIPFRGLVRELTGGAPAQRLLNAAIDAGHARRGFLHGLHRARRYRTAI